MNINSSDKAFTQDSVLDFKKKQLFCSLLFFLHDWQISFITISYKIPLTKIYHTVIQESLHGVSNLSVSIMGQTPHNFPIRKQLKRGGYFTMQQNFNSNITFTKSTAQNQAPLWTKHEDGYHVAPPQGKVGWLWMFDSQEVWGNYSSSIFLWQHWIQVSCETRL